MELYIVGTWTEVLESDLNWKYRILGLRNRNVVLMESIKDVD